MRRLPNWQTRLARFITANADRHFKYGAMDCGLFVADALREISGEDVAVELRGAYNTRPEAFAALRATCGVSTMDRVAAHFAAQHGLAKVPVEFAHRGDPVVLRNGSRSSLGIVDLTPGFILTPFRFGLLRLPLALARIAYHLE